MEFFSFISSRLCLFLLFLLLIITTASRPSAGVEARPISLFPQQRLSKMLQSMGMICNCCDGSKGECTGTWAAAEADSCSHLRCLPWKQPHDHDS